MGGRPKFGFRKVPPLLQLSLEEREMGRRASAVVGAGFHGALTEKVRAKEHLCPTGFGFLHSFVEWLAGVWCGRCGLIARVPQNRMLSRSVTLNGLDGKLLRGTVVALRAYS